MTLDDLSPDLASDRLPDRIVELDEEAPVVLEAPSSEGAWNWADESLSNDQRLLDERPPHWD